MTDQLRIIVIGYGNTLRGDDAIGVLAVEALEDIGMPANVDLLTCQQITPELSEELAFSSRVAFIDASDSGSDPPGTIRRIDLDPRPVDPEALPHGFDIADLLELTSMQYNRIPKAVLFSITGESFDLSEALSPAVERALPELLIQVEDWVMDARS